MVNMPLTEKSASSRVAVELRNGIPVWVHAANSLPVTSEFVRTLMDQADADEFREPLGEELENQ